MNPQPSDLTLEEAIRHWTLWQSGNCSEEDERRLTEWIAAAPENRAAYEKVAGTWLASGKLERREPRHIASRPMFTARPIARACALGVLSIAGLAGGLYVSRWWNGVPVHWISPRGAPRTVSLEEGTRVLLDADSDLVTKLGAHARRVSLVRGEALFTVGHDASRPFVVEIGPGRVVDLGTRFDIERLPHSVKVTVFEGRVGLRTGQGELVLAGGSSAGYDDAGELLPVGKVDAAAMLRADGERYFENEPLAAVVARVARYHSVTFEFSDPQLQDLRVSGSFRVTDLPAFLRTLTTALPIEAHWADPGRVQFVSRSRVPAEGARGEGGVIK